MIACERLGPLRCRGKGPEMVRESETELLTIAEAARLLTVSTVTLRRWLRDGRLSAYHVGPKAVRIRRQDLARVMTPSRPGHTPLSDQDRSTQIHTTPDTIRPLTEEEKQRALKALDASRQLGERIRARRGGQPLAETWPLIREAREARDRQLQ